MLRKVHDAIALTLIMFIEGLKVAVHGQKVIYYTRRQLQVFTKTHLPAKISVLTYKKNILMLLVIMK